MRKRVRAPEACWGVSVYTTDSLGRRNNVQVRLQLHNADDSVKMNRANSIKATTTTKKELWADRVQPVYICYQRHSRSRLSSFIMFLFFY